MKVAVVSCFYFYIYLSFSISIVTLWPLIGCSLNGKLKFCFMNICRESDSPMPAMPTAYQWLLVV